MVGGLADWFAVTALFRRPARAADPPHRHRGRAQGQLRRHPGRLRPGQLPHTRRGRRAGPGRRWSCPGLAAWLADPDHARRPPVTWPAAPSAWPTCCATTTCRGRSDDAGPAAARRRSRSPRWPGGPSHRLTDGRAATTILDSPARRSTATSTSTGASCATSSATSRPGGCPARSRTASSSAWSTAAGGCCDEWPTTPTTAAPGARRSGWQQLAVDLEHSPSTAREGRGAEGGAAGPTRWSEWVGSLWADAQGPAPRDQADDPASELRAGCAGWSPRPAGACRTTASSPPGSRTGARRGRPQVAGRFHGEIASLVSAHHRPLGHATRRPTAWSCCSGPTCSTSGSTAPWSAPAPG